MQNPYRNRNVLLILAGGSLHALANSILWVLTTFIIYGLGGSNTDLGRILGTATITGVAISFMASYLADKTRRDVILVLSMLLESVGVYILASSKNLDDIFVGQILLTAGGSAVWPILTAYLSVSVPSSKKNRVFGTNFLFNNFAFATGGIISYFILRGEKLDDIDNLNTDLLQSVMMISLYLFISSTVLMLFLRERFVLSERDEAEGEIIDNTHVVKTRFYHGFINPKYFEKHTLKIILFTLTSSYLIGMGAGISIPYFPRFFFDLYSIDLANLNLLFASMTVVTAVWGKINANLADKYGRNQLIAVNQLVSVILLLLLASIPPISLAFIALFVRNAAMNGTGPLFNAIQMDYTPRNYRSLINAINNMAWGILFSVGQILGGILVDTYGFSLSFVITATLYGIAILPFLKIKSLEIKVKMMRNDIQVKN